MLFLTASAGRRQAQRGGPPVPDKGSPSSPTPSLALSSRSLATLCWVLPQEEEVEGEEEEEETPTSSEEVISETEAVGEEVAMVVEEVQQQEEVLGDLEGSLESGASLKHRLTGLLEGVGSCLACGQAPEGALLMVNDLWAGP